MFKSTLPKTRKQIILRDTLKAQILYQPCYQPVEVLYSNEIIKKYETKFVMYLHITRGIFVCT